MKWLKNYKYKNLTLIFISILFAIFLSKYNFLNKLLFKTKYIPFVGSFIAGALYISSSTAALGVLMLTDLSKKLHPIEISLLAGLGGAVADFAIFRFFRNGLLSEITPIYNKLGGKRLTALMRHRTLRWILPIIGALIIASPFPDEIGISLMGLTHIKNYQLIILCLTLNTIRAILLVSTLALF